MTTQNEKSPTGDPQEAPDAPRTRKKLTAAAQRALAEAAKRRKALDAAEQQARVLKEMGGRNGPEPTRYGDWEKKGIISDF